MQQPDAPTVFIRDGNPESRSLMVQHMAADVLKKCRAHNCSIPETIATSIVMTVSHGILNNIDADDLIKCIEDFLAVYTLILYSAKPEAMRQN